MPRRQLARAPARVLVLLTSILLGCQATTPQPALPDFDYRVTHFAGSPQSGARDVVADWEPPDALVAGTVYFTTFQPSNEVCSAGGRSWLSYMIVVSLLSGSCSFLISSCASPSTNVITSSSPARLKFARAVAARSGSIS